ncbi:PadR family transcriptional regulator [Orenia marismortui]|uniref:DNA-binding PadR family transcriptional regulator n=1 Tax=Orenia marismortui TaxID=46469 RepID=A0A4R8H288_9FIRM|nr:PadR family transcriptional regulator [Orenia marismortui]TDX52483.1 DNA-binding PadR family transcriptional regulator [Orenia marismortui]
MILISLKHGILGLLSYNDMTGYDLSKYFDQSLQFFWNAQKSQIYRDLGNLEEKEFVESNIVHQKGKPDKKVYSITKNGEEELVNWINQYSFEDSMKIRDSFLMRIFFSAKGNNQNLKIALQEYIQQHQIYLDNLDNIKKKYIKEDYLEDSNDYIYWAMSIKKGYYNFKANIEWANDILEMLDDL